MSDKYIPLDKEFKKALLFYIERLSPEQRQELRETLRREDK